MPQRSPCPKLTNNLSFFRTGGVKSLEVELFPIKLENFFPPCQSISHKMQAWTVNSMLIELPAKLFFLEVLVHLGSQWSREKSWRDSWRTYLASKKPRFFRSGNLIYIQVYALARSLSCVFIRGHFHYPESSKLFFAALRLNKDDEEPAAENLLVSFKQRTETLGSKSVVFLENNGATLKWSSGDKINRFFFSFLSSFAASKVGTYSVLQVVISLQRHTGYFLIQIYLPCTLLVVLSWVGFWLNREATSDRVGLGTYVYKEPVNPGWRRFSLEHNYTRYIVMS